MKAKYITVHNTGNVTPKADALGHAEYLKGGSAGSTGWHFTVDDKRVVQHIPATEIAYHAGDGGNGPGNTTSIGVEICENEDGDYARAEANAIQLIRQLMVEHSIPIENVVPHQKWTGKYCPHKILPRWDSFINEIRLADVPEWARPSVLKALNKKVLRDPKGDETLYRVLVILDQLKILG
jgi:N-acetylmuramoyl-L-alanine amidase